jgi:anti-sigma B factor antagonist
MPFTVDRSTLESGVLLLKLSGTITMGSQLQSFEWAVEEETKKNNNRIVVDLSQITYLDSAGVGVLVGCHGVAKNSGGAMRLAGPTDRVKAIFKLTGLEKVLHIDATLDAAVAALTPPGSGA